MTMAPKCSGNRYRGEVILDRRDCRLRFRLSLNALAELEAAFDLEGVGALMAKLADPQISAAAMETVLTHALMAGSDLLATEAHDRLADLTTAETLALYRDLMRVSFVSPACP